MSKIIKADFDGSVVTLNSDGWINATGCRYQSRHPTKAIKERKLQ